MREFGRLQTGFWRNPGIRSVSDRAKLLATYLISSPHSNAVGAYVLPLLYVAEDLGWDIKTVSKAFEELFRIGFVERDEITSLVLLSSWWDHNGIENPNVAKAAVKLIRALQNCPTKQRLIANIRQHFIGSETVTESVSKVFAEAFPNMEMEIEREIETGDGDRECGGAPFDQNQSSSIANGEPDELTKALDLWNHLAAECSLPRAEKLTAQRRRYLGVRIKEHGLSGWMTALDKVRSSRFLRGEKDFKASFDWLLNASNFVKVREGNYDDRDGKSPNSPLPTAPHRQRIHAFRKSGFWPPMAGPAPGNAGCEVPDDLLTPHEIAAKHGQSIAPSEDQQGTKYG